MSSPAQPAVDTPVTPPPGRLGVDVVVEHVSKTYDHRIRALDDVSVRLEPGQFVALEGPSGCGKSTLLNLIGGLDHPDSGSILVDGRAVPELPDADYRRETIGFVFQLHQLLPVLSLRSNVELPLIAARIPRAERRERAREMLAEVGLGDRADDSPAELSGGERQRVAVARALANRPRLLLADEPTGSLDSDNSVRVLELLMALRQRHGMTVLMVTHDPAISEYADRRLRMLDGRILDRVEADAPTPAPAPRPGPAA